MPCMTAFCCHPGIQVCRQHFTQVQNCFPGYREEGLLSGLRSKLPKANWVKVDLAKSTGVKLDPAKATQVSQSQPLFGSRPFGADHDDPPVGLKMPLEKG